MRVFLPMTPALLSAQHESDCVVPPSWDGCAVTPTMVAAYPDAGEEELEFACFEEAVHQSHDLLAHLSDGPWLRVVVVADVPDAVVNVGEDAIEPHCRVVLTSPVPWDTVISFHVDESAAQSDVWSALQSLRAGVGHEGEPHRVPWVDADVMWFDATEREHVVSSLTNDD